MDGASGSGGSAGQQQQDRKSILDALDEIMRKPRTIPVPRWITPTHSTTTLSECFGHASFVLVAISYAVDDFLTLRMIAVAGSTAMLFFAYFHPYGRILWIPFKWNLLFTAINSYRIGRVYLDRYYAERLSEYWINFRNKNFYLMDPTDYAKLVTLGAVKEFREGDLVVAQGEDNPYVGLVLDGQLKVFRDGKLTYLLNEANFVSESGLHAGLLLPGRIESCCSVVADSPTCRVLLWDRSELVALMHRKAGVRRSLKAILSWDIVSKLKAQRDLLSSGRIDDPEQWTERRNVQTQHRYAAILYNALLQPEFLSERRKQIAKYRIIHHIDDETHEKALEEVGWTKEEYERGYRDIDLQYDESYLTTLRLRMRSYVYGLYLRIIGAKDFE